MDRENKSPKADKQFPTTRTKKAPTFRAEKHRRARERETE
jgi:hypothetical protein